jgi:hypothetical protein
MRGISDFGLWICAGLYLSIGIFGVFFLGMQPNPATSSASTADGYGIVRVAVQTQPQIARP